MIFDEKKYSEAFFLPRFVCLPVSFKLNDTQIASKARERERERERKEAVGDFTNSIIM
jgi:hypothetical protein